MVHRKLVKEIAQGIRKDGKQLQNDSRITPIGKWLRKQGVVIIHRDVTNGENLYWSFWKSESYLAFSTDIEKLSNLLEDNLPTGAISDWKRAIVSAVTMYFGDIPHQRCLIHVVRQGESDYCQKEVLLKQPEH